MAVFSYKTPNPRTVSVRGSGVTELEHHMVFGGLFSLYLCYQILKGVSLFKILCLDTEKIFSANAFAPDLYMIMYDAKYSRLHLGKTSQEIPLGIRIKTPMSVRFEQVSETEFTVVTLVDKLTGKNYNLLGRSYTTELLEVGDLEGRFYLQVSTDDLYTFPSVPNLAIILS